MTTNPQAKPETRTTTPNRAITRYLVRETMGMVMLAVLLFWPAGRLDWGMGWALVALNAAWVTANAWILIRRSPGLLAERLGPKKGSKRWDTVILGIMGLLNMARCIVGGFDQRFAWSTGISLPAQVLFIAVSALGYALFVWALAANAYFSQTVRIQQERGHTVAQNGPYRFVRHPGYIGGLLSEIAAPFILGSWWAFIPSGLFVILMVVRTALEDRTLQAELPGYPEYTQKVKYRLVPGIW